MSDKNPDLAQLAAQLDNQQHSKGLPPLAQWNPPFKGDLDMRIARDGSWHYLGTPILRKELVRLFSTILQREGDDYFLLTPVEKFRIQVEDAPFLAISVETREVAGKTLLEFATQIGDKVIADAEHPLRVETDGQTGEPSPYIRVRSNLDALISRPVFYQLVEQAEEETVNGIRTLVVSSAGQRFCLGAL